jgi:UDP-2,4-diacetamido-2,4,6-trideoxy-beta-L-altropyranose hydrolase
MASGGVLIRTDASNEIGMGHVNRCISIARYLEEEQIKTLFVLRYASSAVVAELKRLGAEFFLLDERCRPKKEAEYLSNYFAQDYPVALFDFAHYPSMEIVDEFHAYFELLNSVFKTTVLIDGFKDTAIVDHIDPAIDIVITPYIGADKQGFQQKRAFRHLAGPAYFIFTPEYVSEHWRREVRHKAEKILVSMGGSDPYDLTLTIMAALALVKTEIHCRIIVGPDFSNHLTKRIEEQCRVLPFCEIVIAPPNLVPHLKWAEMAIGASGLTKYEMAFAGVPSLQLSFNAELADLTAQYEKEGFYRNLGLFSKSNPETIAREIDTLVVDFKARQSMIERGQAMFDLSGWQQLIRIIKSGIMSVKN